MKIAHSIYELESNHSLNARSSQVKRKGALLKITFEEDLVGYADCHVWPELGDAPLEKQLELLSDGKLTPITCCALELGLIDAKFRSQGKNILSLFPSPKSHFLGVDFMDWTSQHVNHIVEQGYTHVKLKMGRHIDREIEKLNFLFAPSSLKLRLDFNTSLSEEEFRQCLPQMLKLKEHIDFIEDPFTFHAQKWSAIQNEGWRLAVDRQAEQAVSYPKAACVLIIKPALHSSKIWQEWRHRPCVVTSYLGHPLGQVAAAYVAACIDPERAFVHGLLSHQAYLPNLFSLALDQGIPYLIPVKGSGFGFDEELNQLEWVAL